MAGIEDPRDTYWSEKLPYAFQQRMQRMLGDEYERFLASYSEKRRQGLRLNTLKKGYEKLETAIEKGRWPRPEQQPQPERQKPGDHPVKIPWVPHGFYYSAWARPGKHPFHEAGVYYIQEPSAMAVAALSGVQPGMRVLDLCAAPGGKSTQLASALQGRGFLVSNEIHPARARILSQNIERMGIRNAVVTNETPAKLAARFPFAFDLVVVDAPCSGEGMFRKEEAAIPNWSPENVSACAERQREILDYAAQMTAEGGRLVYSTCTFAPEENEGNAADFLQRHPEFTLADLPAQLGEDFLRETGIVPGNPDWTELRTDACKCPETPGAAEAEICRMLCRTLRLWPHRLEGEGHFLAVFRRKGNAAPGTFQDILPEIRSRKTSFKRGRSGRAKDRQDRSAIAEEEGIRAWREFAEEFLTENARMQIEEPAAGAGRFVLFGSELYVMPCSPDLNGLKVLRPGLHLGTVRKNRFEPSHALALALSPEDVNCCAEAGKDVWRYLHGESLTAEETVMAPEKDSADGYCIEQSDVCFAADNFPTGEPGCRIIKSGKGSCFDRNGRDGRNGKDSRGWCLVTVSGYSLGWGKLVGNQIKNHYPKGLRIQPH